MLVRVDCREGEGVDSQLAPVSCHELEDVYSKLALVSWLP
jgi:hypothetical protein